MKSLIHKLAEIPGPCGYETQVRAAVRAEVEALADEVHIDGLGNLIVRKGERRSNGKRILALAHLDEPGFIVSHVRRDGLARFMPLGRLRAEVLAGNRVRFLNGTPGVIGYAVSEDGDAQPEMERLFIDTGAVETAQVKIGDVAVFDAPFLDLGQRAAGKALDDRIGVAILIETLRRLHQNPGASPHEIHFAFTVQEVEGMRGAGPAAFQVEPELALAVDMTESYADPEAAPAAARLGAGAVLRMRDASMFTPAAVMDWMIRAAKTHAIPYQIEIVSGETTGARPAQTTNRGAAAGVVAVPCRYRGSPSELVDLDDVQAAADLFYQLLTIPVEL